MNKKTKNIISKFSFILHITISFLAALSVLGIMTIINQTVPTSSDIFWLCIITCLLSIPTCIFSVVVNLYSKNNKNVIITLLISVLLFFMGLLFI